MSAYIPPGPQAPFDKDRSYGQQPGFVSRHAWKIVIFILVLIVIIAIAVFTSIFADSDDSDDEPTALSPVERIGQSV